VAAAKASEAAVQQQLDSAAAVCCDLQEALVREQSAHAATQQLAVEHLATLCSAVTAESQEVQQVEVGESPLQLQQLQTLLDRPSAVLRNTAVAAAQLREAVQQFLHSEAGDSAAATAAVDATASSSSVSNSVEVLAEALTHKAQAVAEQLNLAEIGRITLEEHLCTVNTELQAVLGDLSTAQTEQAELEQQLQVASEERDKLSAQVQAQQQKQLSMTEVAVQVSPLVSATGAQTDALQHDAVTAKTVHTQGTANTDAAELHTASEHAACVPQEGAVAQQQRSEISVSVDGTDVEIGASPLPHQQRQRSSTTDKVVQALQQQQQHRHRPPLPPASPTAQRVAINERRQQQEQQHYMYTAGSSDGEEQQQQQQQLSCSSIHSEDCGGTTAATTAAAVNVTAFSNSSNAAVQRQRSQQQQYNQPRVAATGATAAAAENSVTHTGSQEQLQQRLHNADTQLHRLTQALQEQRTARARAEQRAAAADSTVTALRAQISTDRAVLKRLQSESEKARHLCSSVASQVQELKLARQQLAAASAVQSTLQHKLQQCEGRLQTAEAAAAAATSELEALPRDALVAQAELRCVCASTYSCDGCYAVGCMFVVSACPLVCLDKHACSSGVTAVAPFHRRGGNMVASLLFVCMNTDVCAVYVPLLMCHHRCAKLELARALQHLQEQQAAWSQRARDVAANVDSERRSMLRRIQEQALAVHQLSAYAAQAQHQQQQQQQCSSTRSESGMLSNWQQQQQQVRSTTVHDRWSSGWCASINDELNNSSSLDRRVVNSSVSKGDSHRVRSSGAGDGAGDGSSVCSNASSSSSNSGVSDDRASYVLPAEDASMYRHSYRSVHMASSQQQQQQQQQQLQQQHTSGADVTRLATAATTSALYESGITDHH
jgi:hypothetical protein